MDVSNKSTILLKESVRRHINRTVHKHIEYRRPDIRRRVSRKVHEIKAHVKPLAINDEAIWLKLNNGRLFEKQNFGAP